MREKVAEGRMRGQECPGIPTFPLTLALSLMERGYIYPWLKMVLIRFFYIQSEFAVLC